MTATTTSKAARRSFKVCEDAMTLKSSIAYLKASAADFVANNEHVTSVKVDIKHCKVNDRLELVVSDKRTRKPVHLSINSTCALDWRKINEAYGKRVDKIIERERTEYKGCKPARKSSAPTKADLMRQLAELQAQLAALQNAAQ